jgi:hypothetical protein
MKLIAKLGFFAAALLPLFRITSDSGNRVVFGLYSASYFGLIVLWWILCGLVLLLVATRDPRKRLERMFKTILAIFSLAIALLAVEIYLHARPGLVPLSVRSRLAAGGAFLDFQGAPGSVEVPGVRYPFIPNQSDVMTESVSNLLSTIRIVKAGESFAGKTYSRTTDYQGFCNPVSITGKVDCLFIGDSFTEMSHLPWEQSWPTLLSARSGWTMRNLGKGGISPAEGVRILERFGAAHQPKLVVFSIFEGNDPWDSDCWELWQASGLGYTRFLVKRERFVNRIILLKWYEDLAGRLAAWSPGKAGAKTAPGMTYLRPFVERLAIPASGMREFSGWRSVERSVMAAKRWCDQHGARLVVVHWPSKEHLYALHCAKTNDEVMRRDITGQTDPVGAASQLAEIIRNADAVEVLLKECCNEAGVPYCSVLDPLRATIERGQAPYYLDDIHPNQEGNRVVVDCLVSAFTAGLRMN